MFRFIGIACATLAIFSIAGGQWAVVQTVAWAQMLHRYTEQTGSVASAVEQTFDGQHPCELCLAIKAAKSSEKQNPATPKVKDDAKVKALIAESLLPSSASLPVDLSFAQDASATGPSRAEEPPTPPPRLANIAA